METFSYIPADEKLFLTDTFSFLCHKELKCFNSCCRNKYLPLTPYDVLRLKNGLKIHSDNFLQKYTLYRIDENSGFPVISLKMKKSTNGSCPFVSEEGCLVYKDRPSSCRLYPLGRACEIKGNTLSEAFYFRLNTPGCLGTKEKAQWKISDWVKNQGLAPYIKWTDRMRYILFHPKRGKRKPLSQGQLQKVIIAWYNLDVFREFVFKTEFLSRVQIDSDLISQAKQYEEALLEISFLYLEHFLF